MPDLPNLKILHIEHFGNERLPDGGWERPVALQTLELWRCTGLKSLPGGLARLQSLENLLIMGCSKLESLEYLYIEEEDVGKLERLPGEEEGLGQLKKLNPLKEARIGPRFHTSPALASMGKGFNEGRFADKNKFNSNHNISDYRVATMTIMWLTVVTRQWVTTHQEATQEAGLGGWTTSDGPKDAVDNCVRWDM
ncbi:hypothetical protein ACLOJK_008036 [Asimina triloba]